MSENAERDMRSCCITEPLVSLWVCSLQRVAGPIDALYRAWRLKYLMSISIVSSLWNHNTAYLSSSIPFFHITVVTVTNSNRVCNSQYLMGFRDCKVNISEKRRKGKGK